MKPVTATRQSEATKHRSVQVDGLDIFWGKNDEIFTAAGAEAYLKDLPDAELNLLDTVHFALEEDSDLIAQKIRDFLSRHAAQQADPSVVLALPGNAWPPERSSCAARSHHE